MTSQLILASASPRRLELLTQIGVRVRVLACEVPELRAPGEAPRDYSQRVARAKAAAGWRATADEPVRWVLGADTEVVLDDHVFGKPQDAGDARRMLRALSGREHRVLSSVALLGAGFDEVISSDTYVRFGELGDDDIDAYVASGEPFGKAGAYAIQGRAALFVARIDGSYTGVMGLPLFETGQLLRRARLAVG